MNIRENLKPSKDYTAIYDSLPNDVLLRALLPIMEMTQEASDRLAAILEVLVARGVL